MSESTYLLIMVLAWVAFYLLVYIVWGKKK